MKMRRFGKHFLHSVEQFGRRKWPRENLESLNEVPILEADFVEKATYHKNRNSGNLLAQIDRSLMPRHVLRIVADHQ